MVYWDIDSTLVRPTVIGPNLHLQALGLADSLQAPAQKSTSGMSDYGVLRILSETHGLPVDDDSLALGLSRLDEISRQALPAREYHLLAGVNNVYRAFASLQFSQALFTGNTEARARLKVGKSLILRLFDLEISVFSGRYPSKLDAARSVPEMLKVKNMEAGLVIGDSPLDIELARALHVPCLAVASGEHSIEELALHRPVWLGETLTELTFADIVRLTSHSVAGDDQ